jgi:hypothetical protein
LLTATAASAAAAAAAVEESNRSMSSSSRAGRGVLQRVEGEGPSREAKGLLAVVQGWEKSQGLLAEWPSVERLVGMLQVGAKYIDRQVA